MIARCLAVAAGSPAVVAVTFSPRPEQLLSGGRPILPDICSLDERIHRLERAGADAVAVVAFTPAVMATGACEFMGLLREIVPMTLLCVGNDFKLGRDGTGNIDALRELGFAVEVVDVVAGARGRQKISSSTIRRAIKAGVPAALAFEGSAPVLGDEPVEMAA